MLADGSFGRVKAILDRHDGLFIDEVVQAGFGRTRRMFRTDHYRLEPNIMGMAKGIADGFPLSAFIGPSEIAHRFQPGEQLSTFGDNPTRCARGPTNIQVLRERQLPERAAELSMWVADQLRAMAERHPVIGDECGRGLIIGIELVRDRPTKESAPTEAAAVRCACPEHGVLVGVGEQDGNVIRF